MEEKYPWLNEYIKEVPNHKNLYSFMKLVLFKCRKGLTYKEMYLIFKKLYSSKFNEDVSKKMAFSEILYIYYFNNKEKINKGNERI